MNGIEHITQQLGHSESLHRQKHQRKRKQCKPLEAEERNQNRSDHIQGQKRFQRKTEDRVDG